MKFEIAYGKGSLSLEIPDSNLNKVLSPVGACETCDSEEVIVKRALENPIGSEQLRELVKKIKRILLITSDITRPVPSKITIPLIIEEIRKGNENARISVLIASGLHRASTEEENREKFGDIVDGIELHVHDAKKSETISLGKASTGLEIKINKLVKECDLLIAEGFIEAHFFAGFTGGRKAILPGIVARGIIMENHSASRIDHPKSRMGILEDNPIHEEMVEVAEKAGLKFILNVVLDENKRIINAFAGNFKKAHEKGCKFVLEHSSAKAEPADIVITSNGGYPQDRNLYQAVKGMTTAEKVVKKDGVIIIASECMDGMGHEDFYRMITETKGPADVLEKIRNGTIHKEDQWQIQILARVLERATVIVVSKGVTKEQVEGMYMRHAENLEKALEKALEIKGADAKVTAIPSGPQVIPVV